MIYLILYHNIYEFVVNISLPSCYLNLMFNKHIFFNLGSITFWSYEEWNGKIQKNFEAHFWIPQDKNIRNKVESLPELINRRGIYKDTLGASNKWGDYQLRCNYPVAMAVVSLFNIILFFIVICSLNV